MAISFGCASLIINGGIIYFIFRGLREDAIHGRHGHIQVYRRGYTDGRASEPFNYTISNSEYDDIRHLLAGLPHVVEVTPRLEMTGLISYGGKSVSFLGFGVEAEKDAQSSAMISVTKGDPLSASEPHGVILGKGLAARLEAQVGDFATLLANTRDGGYNAIDVRIRGIFEGGLKEFDDWVMKIPLTKAQELLNFGQIQSIIVLLDHTENTDMVRARMLETFAEHKLDLEMTTWQELAVFYNQVVSMFGKELNIVKIIISIIVILSIINSMTMSIYERTREIGTIMALGTLKRNVLRMFLLEGLILGLAGGLLGILAGVAIAQLISYIGIPMPPPPASTRPFVARVDIIPSILFFSFSISVGAALLASVYPAYRASQLRIVDALRYI
jgi:putative ABC transport system permease protein